jgi:hypothetical protein
MKQVMISVRYARNPGEETYRAQLDADEVDTEAESPINPLYGWIAGSIRMEMIIEQLHHLLRKYPDAGVMMAQGPTRGSTSKRPPAGYQLDQTSLNLIRTNLEAAKAIFSPQAHTIGVAAYNPEAVKRLEFKEEDNVDEPT